MKSNQIHGFVTVSDRNVLTAKVPLILFGPRSFLNGLVSNLYGAGSTCPFGRGTVAQRFLVFGITVVKNGKRLSGSIVPNVKVQPGQRYGRLLVVKRLQNDDKGRSVFLCCCDCKNEVPVRGSFMSRPNGTRSCGCSRADHLARIHGICRRGWGEAAKHATYLQTKGSAVKRGLTWNITEDQFHSLAQQVCRYCGCPPSNMTAPRYGRYGTYRYNGIDRIDSSKGYSAENCGTSCWICNRAKNSMTEAKFMAWVKRVCAHSASSYGNDTTDFEI
jgi:hypothetical protein